MERVLVVITAVALLVSGMGHGRADYVFPYQLGSPGSGDGYFSTPQGLAVDYSGNVVVADALDYRIQVLTGSRPFLTDFGNLGSAGRQPSEPTSVVLPPPANTVVADWLNARTRQLTSDVTFLGDFGSFSIAGVQFNNLSGLDVTLSGDIFVADTIDHRGMSTSDDLFLAKFGSFGIEEAQSSKPTRVAVDPSENGFIAEMVLNHKLLLSLSLILLGALGTLGYSWRRRKRLLHRTLRGPRRTAPYRSPSLPNPRGNLR